MNKIKPFLRVLAGERLNPPPIWIMRQAGRYLPEYWELRNQAGDFLNLCYTPELAAEVTLQPIRRFGFDVAILFADILLVPHALGLNLSFESGTGPQLSPIKSHRDIDALCGADDIHKTLSPVYQTLRMTKEALPDQTALLGFAGSPWTTATYMIAGNGTFGRTPAIHFLEQQPQAFETLIQILTKATIEYLSQQINAGAEAVQLFDTWAGALADQHRSSEFCKYVMEPNIKIAQQIKHRHPDIPVVVFPRKIRDNLPEFASQFGANCIALDHSVSPQWINNKIPPNICVQGNLDPKNLCDDSQNLEQSAKTILDGFSNRPHVFNLGHGITPDARIENVERLIEIVRNWKPQT